MLHPVPAHLCARVCLDAFLLSPLQDEVNIFVKRLNSWFVFATHIQIRRMWLAEYLGLTRTQILEMYQLGLLIGFLHFQTWFFGVLVHWLKVSGLTAFCQNRDTARRLVFWKPRPPKLKHLLKEIKGCFGPLCPNRGISPSLCEMIPLNG